MENWLIKKRNVLKKDLVEIKLDDILIDILSRREIKNVSDAKEFISGEIKEHDPFLLKDMQESVKFILDKINSKEKILVSLDYDVDGIISGAIAYKGLKKMGADVECIFPNRVTDGYGINDRIVNYAIDNDFKFILTFDNGVAAFDAIKLARENNIDVIVTDHHEIPQIEVNDYFLDNLVDANFIINPNRKDCEYPFKKICGAMIAYKLILALHEYLNLSKESISEEYSLVTLATICDVMDLVNENRTFVKYGLKLLNNTKNLGLKTLFNKLNLYNISSYDIGFKIGPCFNASGRLSTANIALKLLIESDESECDKIATDLVNLNEDRKKMTIDATDYLIKRIEKEKLFINNIIILYVSGIHESLAGIVAGRIKEKYNVPTIILTDSSDKNTVKGSARSTDGINIYDILSKFKIYFKKFGGHAVAAGMSLDKEKVDEFSNNVIEYMNGLIISRSKNYLVDAILPLSYLDIDFVRQLSMFEPFGKGNPEILLSSLGVKINRISRHEKYHNLIKIAFSQGNDVKYFSTFDGDDILNKIKNKLNLPQNYDIIKQLPKNLYQEKFDVIYKLSTSNYNDKDYLNIDLITLR